MTGREMKQIVDELKAEGNSEEDILAGFYQMFKDGDFDVNDLKIAASFVGYELSPEFLVKSEQEQKSLDENGENQGEQENGKEDQVMNEDMKTFDDKENEQGATENQNQGQEQEEPKKEENNENNEDDERAQARKLFGFDK